MTSYATVGRAGFNSLGAQLRRINLVTLGIAVAITSLIAFLSTFEQHRSQCARSGRCGLRVRCLAPATSAPNTSATT